MNDSRHKVTTYHDFLKSMKSSKSPLSIITPRTHRDQKQNNQSITNQIVPKKQKISSLKTQQSLTSRPKSFQRQPRKTFTSIQNIDSNLTTRFHTQFQSTNTNKNSVSKSKSKSKSKQKSHFQSQNMYSKDSSYKQSNQTKIIPFYINQILLVIEELPRFNHNKITYLDYLEVLRLLNMIQKNYEPSHKDHVFEFWDVICTRDSTINIINFIVLFFATLNVNVSSSKIINIIQSSINTKLPSIKHTKYKTQLFRTDKLGYLSLIDDEVKEIYHRFKEFRTTRMYLGRIQKKGEIIEEKLNNYDSFKYHPTISQKSVKLAEIRKQKEKYDLKMYESHCQFESREEQIKEQSMVSPQQSYIGMKRTEALYNLCKSKSKQKKDRNQDEVQFERNQKSYTFKPQINKKKIAHNPTKKNLGSVSGEIKALQRFLKGRVEKQLRKKSTQKGSTTNSKSLQKLRKKISTQLSEQPKQFKISKQSSVHKTPVVKEINQIPPDLPSSPPKRMLKPSFQQLQELPNPHPRQQIFNFEVYIQGNVFVDSIKVFEGDCVQTLAKEFIKKHNLKEQMQAKLISNINYNLASTRNQDNKLDEIQEESMECSFDFQQ